MTFAQNAIRRGLWTSLAALSLTACISGAEFEPSAVDGGTSDTFEDGGDTAVAMDAQADAHRGAELDVPMVDIAVVDVPDGRDVSVDSAHDTGARPADARSDTGADVGTDTGGLPFPCSSDGECAAGLGEASGPCVVAACHPQSRHCFWRALPNGSVIPPHDPCALASECRFGEPAASVPRVCDDGNACTSDRCEPGVGCTYTPLDGGPCDDANACSTAGHCRTGICVATTNICPCEEAADCAPFNDDNPCNGRLTCDGGVCVVAPETVVHCPPPDEPGCTRLACRPETGVCEPGPAPDGFACEDGDACTTGDTCDGGVCAPGPALDCDDGNPCSLESCDTQSGCGWSALNGDACDDGDPCTGEDSCAEGLCDGERLASCACSLDDDCAAYDDDNRCNGVMACDDDGFCAIDRRAVVVCPDVPEDCGALDCGCARPVCDETTGECTLTALPDGLACRDDDACTLAEECSEGLCEGSAALSCDDDEPCTADHCNADLGCVHEPTDAGCDDGAPCTRDDACVDGACVGVPYACDDALDCTDDICLGNGTCGPPVLQPGFCVIDELGCVLENTPHPDDPCLRCAPGTAPRGWSPTDDGGTCDDGDACTEDDACAGGSCFGITIDCDDEDACTTDGCDPASGCTHEALGCDDGIACTTDSCDTAIGCVNTPDHALCDDDDPCTDAVCDPEAPDGCRHEPNAAVCDDGDPCTVDDVCAGGACTAGPDTLGCDDGVACTIDTCVANEGCEHTPDDAACDDDNPCTEDACDHETGCVFLPVEDGTSCGPDLVCAGGSCDWGGTCDGVVCPPVPDYPASCNAQSHCEYAYQGDDTASWRQWDVWILVPPGSATIGSPETEAGRSTREGPVQTVSFATGRLIAKYEVVVDAYEACEASGACTVPTTDSWDPSGWGANRTTNGRGDHPQNGLSWHQAAAFCAWAAPGGRLPSESEWEYAANGPYHRTYPWGDTPEPTCDGSLAVFDDGSGYGCGDGGTAPVGSRPDGASWAGALSMAGNVQEWTQDWEHADGYEGLPLDGSPWLEPSGTRRMLRGGSYAFGPQDLRSSGRYDGDPEQHYASQGARCVRDLSPIGAYCNVPCPALPGYEATCNAQDHCEYARSEQTEDWHAGDAWIWVPPGMFSMGSPEGEGDVEERPPHDVTLSRGYFVHRHEVTAAAYAAFLDERGDNDCPSETAPVDCVSPASQNGSLGWDGVVASIRGFCQTVPGGPATESCAAHPVSFVGWDGARAYCEWMGGRLPTEAEWERAAKGPTHRPYPWGDGAPGATHANCDESLCGDGYTGSPGTAPVGSFPEGASAVGALDMAGNLWEWVADRYDERYYDDSPSVDPAGPDEGTERAARGGSAYDTSIRAARRRGLNPAELTYYMGFRCVRDVPCADGETLTTNGCAVLDADCAGHADRVLCDDGDPCTEGDACHDGACVPGAAPECDDGESCTVDLCVAGVGCVSSPIPDETTCGDDSSCVSGRCTWSGACAGVTCPSLQGMTAQCNAERYCEYSADDAAESDRWNVWIWLPPGSFFMGAPESEAGSSSDERPTHLVTFASGFFVAKYEIVVEQYEACVADGPCTPPTLHPATGTGSNWGTNRSTLGRAEHPQNGISLPQAEAFCDWLAPAADVPSEAEWEYAATGSVHRTYPWGDAAPSCVGGIAVFDDGDNPGCGTGGTVPVTDLANGAAASGAVHMAGNVSEWVADCWHDHYNPVWVPTDGSAWTTECYAVDSHTYRNGSFDDLAMELRTASRGNTAPDATHVFLGGRCVRRDACDDAVTCTSDTYSVESGCANTPEDAACDDGNPCTTDACDADVGCTNVPSEDGAGCGDGAECVDGECVWLGSCDGVECPLLPDYAAGCNEQHHCEYAYVGDDRASWRQWDAWVYVPSGPYRMGGPAAEGGPDDERPVHDVAFIAGYLIAKYPVTVAQHEACEADQECSSPSTGGNDHGWSLNRSADGRAEHPQNGLDHAQADAVCGWTAPGGRLPSEAEWEAAASGPTHRRYPWGDLPEPTCANDTAVFEEPPGLANRGCGTGGTHPVGSMASGTGWSGALDLSGNVWEWVEDGYHDTYDGAPGDGSAWATDDDVYRVARGSSFADDDPLLLRSSARTAVAPSSRAATIGVRCARSVSPIDLYCNDACPLLAGYDAICNAQNHCEYVRSEPTAAWQDWDVWIWIPRGRFLMGAATDEGGFTNEQPVHEVTFARGFFAAKYEIVVSAHEACEAAGDCDEPYLAQAETLNRSSNGRADHPQNALQWAQAGDFCAWLAEGGRLLSEAEWEYVAGGAEGKLYPWGSEPAPSCGEELAVYDDTALGDHGSGCGQDETWPAGSMTNGASAAGLLDLAGNVAEWVADCHHNTYDDAPSDGSAWTTNCRQSPVVYPVRGGHFDSGERALRRYARDADTPDSRHRTGGGRCARDLPCLAGEQWTPDGCAVVGASCAGHADGVICDDGDSATTEDRCRAGVCEGNDQYCSRNQCWPPLWTGQDFCAGGLERDDCSFFGGSLVEGCAEGVVYCGQDAQYDHAPRAFECSVDGSTFSACAGEERPLVIRDLDTELEWEGDFDYGQNFTLARAREYCAQLEIVGRDDWRVPTAYELWTIVSHHGATNKVFKPAFSFNPISEPYYEYWTSTINPTDGERAIRVGFAGGYVNHIEASAHARVRCVRGGSVDVPDWRRFGRFDTVVASGETVVQDRLADLLWTPTPSSQSLDWPGALAYCEGLERFGTSQWRLPTIAELVSLMQLSIPDEGFDDDWPPRSGLVWSSTSQCGSSYCNSAHWARFSEHSTGAWYKETLASVLCVSDTSCPLGTSLSSGGRCYVESANCVDVPDGTACDDGDSCTENDACANEVCAGTPVICDDGNPCTEESCEVSIGCVSVPVEDGADCGGDHQCVEGECVFSGTCDGVACPTLSGYRTDCNMKNHCRYTPDGSTWDGAYGTLAWVPPGAFAFGVSGEQVTVTFADGYFVDVHEVTVAAFASFLDAEQSNTCAYGGGESPCYDEDDPGRLVDWDGSSASIRSSCQEHAGGSDDTTCSEHPIQDVAWHGAGAFCRWRGSGFRLCSEAEWEHAAKGTNESPYPWGAAAVGAELANCREDVCQDGFVRTAPVGHFPAGASPVGALDMAGNASEWVEDDWHASVAGAPADGSAWDDAPGGSVVRGGAYQDAEGHLRTTWRGGDAPATLDYAGRGFRCCYSL